MARSRFIYTLRQVAGMIFENLELIEEITANSDNISQGELIYVSDGWPAAGFSDTELG